MTATTDNEVAGDVGPRRRLTLWIAVVVAAAVVALVAVMATRPAAQDVGRASPLVGKQGPPIAGTTIDNTNAQLADYAGKWVLVNFFATWCVPCRTEHPELVRFASQHGSDVQVLSVIFDDNASTVRSFRSQHGGGWPMVTDPGGRISVSYGVRGLPESYLIDPAGVVVAKLVGGVTAEKLNRVLDQSKNASLVNGESK